ncbi:MAG: STAS domain-containing protein [SAR324 cluster bacterium]|nr:STAS domain-containing protein [SAR324 cluster bacterium]
MKRFHEVENEICFLYFDKESIAKTESQVHKNVISILENKAIQAFVIDLEQVVSLNSYGIGTLMSVFKTLTDREIKLILCNLTKINQEVFELTQLDRVMTIVPTKTEAIALCHH